MKFLLAWCSLPKMSENPGTSMSWSTLAVSIAYDFMHVQLCIYILIEKGSNPKTVNYHTHISKYSNSTCLQAHLTFSLTTPISVQNGLFLGWPRFFIHGFQESRMRGMYLSPGHVVAHHENVWICIINPDASNFNIFC